MCFFCLILVVLGVVAGKASIQLEVKDYTGSMKIKPSVFWVNFFALKHGYLGKIKKVNVNYTKEEQTRMSLYNNGVLVRNFNLEMKDKELMIYVYYNPLKMDDIFKLKWVDEDIWAMMCVGVRGPKPVLCFDQARNFKKLIKLSEVRWVRPVFAGCSGTIACVVWRTNCGCYGSSGGLISGACDTSGYSCGALDDGICSCAIDCITNLYPGLGCSGSSYAGCIAADEGDCAYGGECPVEQSCTWTCDPDWPDCATDCGTDRYQRTDGCGNWLWCEATADCCTAEGTCTTNCGANAGVPDGACGTKSCACVDCIPSAPTLSSPANGAEIRVGVASTLNWSDVASWGTKCPAPNSNKYNVCLDCTGSSGCNLGYPNVGGVSQYSWTPSVADPTVYWAAIASNGSPLENWSTTWGLCVEGGPYTSNFTPACGSQTRTCSENCGTNDCAGVALTNCQHCAPTIGAWGTCDADHKRTRPCTENDGLCDGSDCAAEILTEDCVGTITGTLFDASDIGSCGEMGTEDKYANQQFTITPANVGKWPILSGTAPTVTTNGSGVYAQNVYASATLPASYSLNYVSLIASGLAAGIKLECQTALPTVTGQAQVVTKDTGFWRVYGGWWQVVGGSVYAESGLKSYVPASVVPAANQKLILADAGA